MSETLLKLGPKDAGMRLSREEFASAEDGAPYRYERGNGKLIVKMPPGEEHHLVLDPFHRHLAGYWYLHPDRIDAVNSEGWLATNKDSDRLPDLCVYLSGPNSSQRRPERVPELVVECVSEGREDRERDYVDKRAEYHAVGVREYVIVDRFKEQVLVLTWAEADFTEKTLSSHERYTTPLLPGLAIALSEAFPAA